MPKEYIMVGAALVIIFIIVSIKQSLDEKKGVNSDDKKAIDNIVNKLISNSQDYKTVYAVWDSISFGSSSRTTSYWYYAIAFKPGTINIIPLSYEGGDVSYGEVICLTHENLGMVNSKDGQLWASFYDKDHKEVVSISVESSNTKDDKYHPVNIQQKEEAEAFYQFIKEFRNEINEANGVTVNGRLGKPLIE